MFEFIIGIILGFWLCVIIKERKELCKNSKKIRKLIETHKETQVDPINIDFKRRKQQIAYSNKVKQVESKINDLKRSKLPEQIAEIMTGQIIVQIADIMVEADRQSGRLDDLYSPKE